MGSETAVGSAALLLQRLLLQAELAAYLPIDEEGDALWEAWCAEAEAVAPLEVRSSTLCHFHLPHYGLCPVVNKLANPCHGMHCVHHVGPGHTQHGCAVRCTAYPMRCMRT